MGEKIEFLDITPGDEAFKVKGKTLNELFENAALALFKAMVVTDDVEHKSKYEMEADGYDLKSLMFDWLSELLFLATTEMVLLSKFEVKIEKVGEEYKLKASCWGEELDREKHDLEAEVKAITYHKMEISEKKGEWTAQVILDL